jgi:antitoxin HigA-1
MKTRKEQNIKRKEILPEDIWNNENKGKVEEFIKDHLRKQTSEQKLKNKLMSIQYRIEDYLNQNNNTRLIELEDFVAEYLKLFRIPKTEFAKILGMEWSNLYKYLKGGKTGRKLNSDIVLKISSFSHTKPEMWFYLEAKNNILELQKNQDALEKYEKYGYENYLYASGK